MFKLLMRQGLPLEEKILLTNRRIKQWYEHYYGKVYVAFSGGKDSTVLLHLVRSLYPDVKAVFCDTGLEFPEIRDFVKTVDNVIWVKPKKTFLEVIKNYGYPVVSKEQSQYISEYRNTKSNKLKDIRFNGKNGTNSGQISKKWKYLIEAPFKISHKCCYYLKKEPSYRYEKSSQEFPIVGTMASESRLRTQSYLKNGCNAFDSKRPISQPIAFWTEEDVWEYIKTFNLDYSAIYNMGYTRTGCVYCMYGCHNDKQGDEKFIRLKDTHPQLYDYCINKLNLKEVLTYVGIKYE